MHFVTSIGFNMVVDLGVEKEYIITQINKLRICNVTDVVLQKMNSCQKASIIVDWLPSQKSKQVYEDLLRGTPFMIPTGIEKYANWMACFEKQTNLVYGIAKPESSS